jgi:hypothetical protein
MKRIFIATVVAASVISIGSAQAADAEALKAEAVNMVKAFGGPLKQALEDGMKQGGPVHTIGVCNEKAPEIAQQAAAGTGWSVARTSLKVRNAKNVPDAWELATLTEFEARKTGGENIDTIAKAEIVEENGQKTFRFMKAIGTVDVCLNCHGANLKPEVAAKVDSLYPNDQARGFSAGDIRGAFTLKKAL